MKIEDKLTASVIDGVKKLYGAEITPAMVQLQKTKKEFAGHLTVVVFPFLKLSKKGPEQTGQEIGEYLKANEPAIADYNVIKGFLNLTIASDVWIDLLNRIHADAQWGIRKADEKAPLVMIEYSSPNTNKPLHLGHVRNNLLGNALANIMAANGNRVVKTNIVNDRGIHICKSMLAWLKYGNGETPESSGKKGDHLIGDYYVAFDKHYKAEVAELMEKGMSKEEAEAQSPLMQEAREMLRKWEAGDPEVRALWEKMNNWVYAGFDETYKMMGVRFDKIYYESNTYLEGKKKVLEGLEKGIFYRKEDGSVWADLTPEGLDQKLLLRADGDPRHRYCRTALCRLSDRQDDIRGRQRTELPLPSAFYPARQAGIRVGKRLGALLLRHGRIARRKDEEPRRYRGRCRRPDGSHDSDC